MNYTKNNGYAFLDFLVVHEDEMNDYPPLAGSFAVLICSGKYLICYNIWREQWELPAGQREEHETPKQCAIRELYEETGQTINDLAFRGLLKVKNISSGLVKFNPVYAAHIEKLQPFRKNDETSGIKLWDLYETIGWIDEIDCKLLNYVK
ncbi:NUDIX domain-containing protein [Jeotgalibacillus campisalis]|uniref:Nudix hydrolase domain-containing protein n=1 Tax=Jeotgalibacillus campisalis TaxID=220754 RepID=A0A0C2VGP2_9BACL|nr:NUDIX hydrolase [Jeotgalibacillus campisalis]KIL43178.1 hypothetical protein KR50_35810 [Jeotgalibacillus campisalis]